MKLKKIDDGLLDEEDDDYYDEDYEEDDDLYDDEDDDDYYDDEEYYEDEYSDEDGKVSSLKVDKKIQLNYQTANPCFTQLTVSKLSACHVQTFDLLFINLFKIIQFRMEI